MGRVKECGQSGFHGRTHVKADGKVKKEVLKVLGGKKGHFEGKEEINAQELTNF